MFCLNVKIQPLLRIEGGTCKNILLIIHMFKLILLVQTHKPRVVGILGAFLSFI